MGRAAGRSPSTKKRECKQPIRVGLVEHHPLAAGRLREILRRDRRLQAFDYDETQARHTVSDRNPLVVLIHLGTLPVPVLKYLGSLRPQTGQARIIALAHAFDDQQTCRLLLSGVHGFVPYEKVEKDLTRAVESVWQGCFWVNRSVLQRLVQHGRVVSPTGKGHREPFTAREKEILRLLPGRLCNKEIAAKIAINERTVRFHLANIFTKLGVHDRYSVVDMLNVMEVSAELDQAPPAASNNEPAQSSACENARFFHRRSGRTS